MSIVRITESYSDVDLACPSDVENGYKKGLVAKAGKSERMLSDPRTGEWSGGSFEYELIDEGSRFRRQIASFTDRYWKPQTVKMTSRANRRVKGPWYVVHHGPVVDVQPTRPKNLSVKLGDIISELLITDQGELPFRRVKDGFLDQLLTIDEHLDRDSPEPTIYGSHRRIPDVDPASPNGFCLVPTYLGTIDLSGDPYHVWLIAGHACSDVPFWRIDDDPTADEGSEWLVPHHANFLAQFGAPYVDYRSSTYGVDRRYTLMFGKVTDLFAAVDNLTDPDACALGHKQLTVAVEGVEDVGDGSGTLITDRIQQYKHWLINYVANKSLESYQAGAWLTNPTWDLFGATVPIIDEDSFDACSAIAALRLPANDYEPTAGYIGAAVIGAGSGEVSSVRRWVAEWNRSCGLMQGITRHGQYKVVMLSPTQAIKDAAQLYTDINHILKDSFQEELRYPEQANLIPFRADKNYATGVWVTNDSALWQDSINNEGRTIASEAIEYPFAPGITASYHLARLELLRSLWPPRRITIETPVTDKDTHSLAYLELGDYVRYAAYPAVANSEREIRVAMIVRIQVQVGARTVLAEAIDCEDLIGVGGALSYDRPPQEAGGPGETTLPPGGTATPIDNFTAFDAITINPFANAYELSLDTTAHPTDANVPAFGTGPGIGYHAAWWTITPDVDKQFSFSTLGSSYDTQLAVFTADVDDPYGTMVEVAYNDNVSPTAQSVVTFDLTGGTTYYILAAGYGPDDGGTLRFAAVAPQVGDLYVSTTGSDSNVGTIDNPLRTLNHALVVLNDLGSGTALVRGGTYAEEIRDLDVAGSDWANKLKVAAFPGETVWLTPPSGSLRCVGFSHQQQYIEFDGVNMNAQNCQYDIFKLDNSAPTLNPNHIRLMNCTLVGHANGIDGGHGNNNGVLVSCGVSGLVGGNEFINVTVHGYGKNDFDNGFYIAMKDTLLDGVTVYDGTGAGIQLHNSDAVAFTGVVVRNFIVRNMRSTASGQRHMGVIVSIGADGAQIYNGVVDGVPYNGATSVGIYDINGLNCKYWNNTVINCASEGIAIETFASGAEVKNNISYNNAGGNYRNSGSGTTASNNSTSGTDPQLVNSSAGDYRLQATSPCIDAGTTVASVTTDINGIPRPQGGAYDQGAHEYVTP